MTADEFFAKLEARPAVPTDVDGRPIEELAGLMIKPLDVMDMIAVSDYAQKHGQDRAWEAMLARGLRNTDGSQVVPDEQCSGFGKCLNVPLKRAIEKIRTASGYPKDDEDTPDPNALVAEKKTISTAGGTGSSFSDSPAISKKRSGR
jgi:hypothetical protein